MVIHYVDSFFANIPYSEEAYNAKEVIIKALKETEEAKSGDFEALVNKYSDLKSLAELAGFTQSDVASWKNTSGLIHADEIKTQFRNKRINTYLFVILAVLAAVFLIQFLFYLKWYYAASGVGLAALAFWAYKKRPAPQHGKLSLDAHHRVRELRDVYNKKFLNAFYFAFVLVAMQIFGLFIVEANYSVKWGLIEFLVRNVWYAAIIVYLIWKNLILANWTNTLLSDRHNRRTTRKLTALLLAISAVYWVIALVMFRLFNTTNIATVYIAVGIYVLVALTFNLTLRKKITFQNIKLNKPRVVIATVLVVAVCSYLFLQKDIWLTQPYINTVANINERNNSIAYDEAADGTGIYTITNHNEDGEFRILQLTDIHLGGSISSYPNDMKALKACFDLIEYAKPDLVVVTGDLSYPVGISSFSLNNTAPVMQFASFMRNVGVAWAFTYGNHDTEAMAATNKETLNDIYMSLSYNTSKNLLYPYTQPVTAQGEKVTGRNNQVIEVRNEDGTLCSALFLIDSNSYIGKGFSSYDYIHDDQVAWYENQVLRLNAAEGKTVSSLVFCHIPLEQYKTAYELWLQKRNEVTYCFGENNEGGSAVATIGCSEYPGTMFDTAERLGSTQGFFCGHDHFNNMSLEYKGIRLTYGMSIDYLVSPGIINQTEQRGATLITLDHEGTMNVEQIPYSDIGK